MKIKRFFNLFITSSKAAFEDPFIGPNLSPYMAKDKIKVFCEAVNLQSSIIAVGLKILVRLYLYEDKSFFFVIKGIPIALLLKLLLTLTFKEFHNTLKIITLFELYDIIICKNIFILKTNKQQHIKPLWIKIALLDNIFSLTNLKIIKDKSALI